MQDTYTDFELMNLTQIPEIILRKKLESNTVHKNLLWMRKLQHSLYVFGKKHKKNIDAQMDVVVVIRHIERYCYPFIYADALNQIKIKYCNDTPKRQKELAKGMAEKTLRKFSF